MSERFPESPETDSGYPEPETDTAWSGLTPEDILEALARAERLRRLGYGWQ